MDKNLKRIENETQDQYFYRICSMKENLGFTWPQMAEIFNNEFGQEIGDTAYRKKWAAFKSIFDANTDKFIEDKSYLNAIVEAQLELKKERYKMQAINLEMSRTCRQTSKRELFYENVKNSIESLPVPDFLWSEDQLNGNRMKYVLTLADIQAGANFRLDCNEYSLEICEQRFNKLLNDVGNYVVSHNILRLTVVGLGDDVQGLLRISDVKLNETSVVEATVTVARLIAGFLNKLSELCRIDYYHVPTSNHSQSRNLGSKANELAYEDVEYIIGHYISDVLVDNNRVSVHLNDGYDYIDIPVFNFNVLAMHGHTIKNLNTALRDLSSAHRRFIDYLLIGHFHNGKVIPGNEHESHDTEVLVCPSFQGTDPYAFNKLGYSSKAACKMFIFDEKYGCTGTQKFILN